MIKQDVGISATSLTGDIVGARAALLADFLLVAERYSPTSPVFSRCGCVAAKLLLVSA